MQQQACLRKRKLVWSLRAQNRSLALFLGLAGLAVPGAMNLPDVRNLAAFVLFGLVTWVCVLNRVFPRRWRALPSPPRARDPVQWHRHLRGSDANTSVTQG